MVLTLLLGWWGIIALFFRNPWAIGTNIYALFKAPPDPGPYGAIHVNQLRANAREQQNLAETYMTMPTWFQDLAETDLDLLLVEQDYYRVLGIAGSATQGEIKAAWRAKVKEHHPDHTGAPDATARVIVINNAHQVLSDEKLRHAYDHREELLEFLGRVRAATGGTNDDPAEDLTNLSFGCAACHGAFYTYDDFADHVDQAHPDADLATVLVHLKDGVPVEEADRSAHTSAPPAGSWRCKACSKGFTDYEEAIAHAEDGHPDRTVVNVRESVEWIV